jgi:orotidine-5'-phosphate decarboxylase
MTHDQLFDQILKKQSYLCLGLDTELSKIPDHLLREEFPVFEFNRRIIDATHDLIIACKPNVAFYESLGTPGWLQFEMTVKYIREQYPDIFIIADAKRGDIGNTSRKYAETFFTRLPCDAVTVAPYMGSDSVLPFLGYPGKWVALLALTSNPGADDYQMMEFGNGERLFETVLRKSAAWGNTGNMMFVVGATRAPMLKRVREIVPDHFLLIPGVGAQGGDLGEVSEFGLNRRCGLIVNSSRAIIYADSSTRFAEVAREKALEVQSAMKALLKKYSVTGKREINL